MPNSPERGRPRTASRRDGTYSAWAAPGRSRAGRSAPARRRAIAGSSRRRLPAHARLGEQLGERLGDALLARARPRGCRRRAGRRSRSRGPRASSSAAAQKASRSSRLTLLRSTAPADLAAHRDPEPRALGRLRRAGRSRGRGSGTRGSGPRGRRGRTRRCAKGGGACEPSLRGEALAALAAPAAQHVAARAGPHAGAEPVRAGPLALLWLVGALHRPAEYRTSEIFVICANVSRRGQRPLAVVHRMYTRCFAEVGWYAPSPGLSSKEHACPAALARPQITLAPPRRHMDARTRGTPRRGPRFHLPHLARSARAGRRGAADPLRPRA